MQLKHATALTWLVLILSSGGIIRFYGLSERGYFEPDEATYHQIARSNYLILSWIGQNLEKSWPADAERKDDLLDTFEKQQAVPISNYASKPLYHLLNLFSITLLGTQLSALLYTSAIFGWVTILLMYRIGRDAFSSSLLGCLAGGTLALSVLHTEFSRSGMPLGAAIFFYTLGLYLYLLSWQKSTSRYLWGVGLAFGCTFLTHPNALPFLGVAFFTELFALWQERKVERFFKRCCWVYGFCAVPELIADSSVLLLKCYIEDDLIWLYSSSFQGDWSVFNRLQTNLELLLRLPNDMIGSYTSLKERLVMYLLYYPLGIEGLSYTFLSLGGLFLAIKKCIEEKDLRYFTLVSCIIPYLFYVFIYKTAMLRSIAFSLPYSALWVGIIGCSIFSRAGKYRIGLIILAVALFTALRLSDLKIVAMNQSGFVKAASWLKERHAEQILGLNMHRLWLSHGIYGYVLVPDMAGKSGAIDTTATGLERAAQLPYVSLWLDNYYSAEFKRVIETNFIGKSVSTFSSEHISSPKRVACSNIRTLNRWLSEVPFVRTVIQWTGGDRFVGDHQCIYPPEWYVKIYGNHLYGNHQTMKD